MPSELGIHRNIRTLGPRMDKTLEMWTLFLEDIIVIMSEGDRAEYKSPKSHTTGV